MLAVENAELRDGRVPGNIAALFVSLSPFNIQIQTEIKLRPVHLPSIRSKPPQKTETASISVLSPSRAQSPTSNLPTTVPVPHFPPPLRSPTLSSQYHLTPIFLIQPLSLSQNTPLHSRTSTSPPFHLPIWLQPHPSDTTSPLRLPLKYQ